MSPLDPPALTAAASRARMEQLRDMVQRETGIMLPESKDVMIESRLKRRVLDLELPDLDAYLRRIFDEGGLAGELDEIIDLLTTNKTDFFREPAHFRLLTSQLIPQALARAAPGARVTFKVWSAASSIGAEAWTTAMLLDRAARVDRRLSWAILGTDISPRVIRVARRAVYTRAELSPVPADMQRDYVMQGRTQQGRDLGRIVPELRARVRFERLNLTQPPYRVDTGIDVAFLRNVLIYFDEDMKQRIIAAVASHLRPQGHLIVGHSESMVVRQPDLAQVAPGVFRKE